MIPRVSAEEKYDVKILIIAILEIRYNYYMNLIKNKTI